MALATDLEILMQSHSAVTPQGQAVAGVGKELSRLQSENAELERVLFKAICLVAALTGPDDSVANAIIQEARDTMPGQFGILNRGEG